MPLKGAAVCNGGYTKVSWLTEKRLEAACFRLPSHPPPDMRGLNSGFGSPGGKPHGGIFPITVTG